MPKLIVMTRLAAVICIAMALALGCCTVLAQSNRLENSPRHLEWVKVAQGDRQVNCFIAYPEVSGKAHAVIVIHEIFGLTDWVRGVADQFAEAGYIAIAPDLLSGMGPNGGGSDSLGGGDGVRGAIGKLPPDQIMADLDAVAAYAKSLEASSKTVAVAGFCWGGGQTFAYACHNPDVAAACVFYGPPPPDEAMAQIKCPVYGFYGQLDGRISTGVPDVEKRMKKLGKQYEPVIYDRARHGFMRLGDEITDPLEPNREARNQSWERLKKILSGLAASGSP